MVPELGLTNLYKESPEVRTFIGMIDALAFLPVDEVEQGMAHLKDVIPDHPGMEELLNYFDSTYVTGTFRRVNNNDPDAPIRVRRLAPQFSPGVWNVHQATIEERSRTNNICEAWNIGFLQLVGHTHPSVWTLIDSIRKDQAVVATLILQNQAGQPPKKRVRRVAQQIQARLLNLCIGYNAGDLTLPDFLRAVSHTIRLD